MYELCTDIGYVTLTKTGEQLCGDHVELVQQADGSVGWCWRMGWAAA